MIISRSELVTALQQVKGAVAEKAFVPILTHVLVAGDAVLGYDSEIGIRAKLSTKLDCSFNVKADTFLQLLMFLEEEDVDIVVVENKIKITCGSHKSTLTQITDEFPKPNVNVSKDDWKECPAGFKEAMERCLLAVSEDENNRALSSMMISGDKVYGADGKRVVRCTVAGLNVLPFLLPRKAVSELIKLGAPKRVAVRDNLAVFDFVNMVFLARLREQTEYPTKMYDSLLKDRTTKHGVPEGLGAALERLALFASDDVGVKVEAGALGLELTINGATSSAQETLAPWPEDSPIKGLNPRMVLDCLSYAESLDWGRSDRDPLYLTGETSGFECLISPMKVS